MTPPEAEARPRWRRTRDPRFPAAAHVDGSWWVLRRNPFPDHDLYTLFVDGTARFDLNDLPAPWGNPRSPLLRRLARTTEHHVLASVRRFAVYGSEAGRPCDDPFCCG